MPGPLVIVESPAKARTIAGFLGRDFVVKASMGHVRDLPSQGPERRHRERLQGRLRGQPQQEASHQGTARRTARRRRAVPRDRRRPRRRSDLLAPARGAQAAGAGEADGVPRDHPSTRSTNAVDQWREVDYGLVDAQESRRIVDRLFGYPVSEVCWRKIRTGLSAGRVQSPSVRLVVQRERERMAFVAGGLLGPRRRRSRPIRRSPPSLVAVDGAKVAEGKDFDSLGQPKRDGDLLVLDEVAARGLGLTTRRRRPSRSAPSRPSRTPRARSRPSSRRRLQQVGGSRLRMSAQHVMRVAQGLYERGYITYMRTDSTTLSETALAAARSQIQNLFGREYLPDAPRSYTRKSKNAQEAHEAIRPAGEDVAHAGTAARRTARRRPSAVRADLAAHDRIADVRRPRLDGHGPDRRDDVRERGHRVGGFGTHDHLPRLPRGVRLRRRRCRGRRRLVGQAARAHRWPRVAGSRHRGARPRHPAAASLHRGDVGARARRARHRPPFDVRVDHADDPRPRVRVEEGPGAGADHRRVRGRQPARTALRRSRRLRLHRAHGGRPRRDRGAAAAARAVAREVLVRQRHARREDAVREGASRRPIPRRSTRSRSVSTTTASSSSSATASTDRM